MRAILLAMVALSACVPNGFTGDAGTVYFETTLSRDYESFTPWRPVAQGTHLSVKAVQVMPYSFISAVDPKVTASVSGALTTEKFEVDQWSGWATAAGESTMSWSGSKVADQYVLTVAPAASIDLYDPLVYYADDGYGAYHGAFEDVGRALTVAPGGWIYLELVPRTASGISLAFEPGWISVDGGGDFFVDPGGHGVNIVAPVQGPSTSSFTLTAGDSGVSETVTLYAPADPTDGVSSLEIVVGEADLPGAFFVLRAVAHLQDGGVMLAPDVDWTLPGVLVDLQTPNNPVFTVDLPRRRDARIVALRGAAALAGVSYAGLDASVMLVSPVFVATDAGTQPPPPATTPPAPATLGCVGCSTGGGTLGVLALLLLLGARTKRL